MTSTTTATTTSYAVSGATVALGAAAHSDAIAAPAPVVQTLIFGVPLAEWSLIVGILGVIATTLITLVFRWLELRVKQSESELRRKVLLDKVRSADVCEGKVIEHD